MSYQRYYQNDMMGKHMLVKTHVGNTSEIPKGHF